jgi:hypothetical protein
MPLKKAHFDDISVRVANQDPYERKFYTNSTFFDDCEFYQIEITDKKVIIKKCCLDTPEDAKTINRNKKGHISFALTCDVPYGVYPFDKEETNDDELVFYYNGN